MKHTRVLKCAAAIRADMLAGALALIVAGATPATAQFVHWGYPGYAVVPPHEATAAVRSAGLRPASAPTRHGPAYVLSALDPAGQELRVVVDARSGRVVRSVPVSAPRYSALPPNYARPPSRIPLGGRDADDPDRRIAALPPDGDAPTGSTPGGGIDGPPPPPTATRTPAARAPAPSAAPARPPLPRPRPTMTATAAAPPSPQAVPPKDAGGVGAVPAAPSVETEFHE